MATGTLRGRSRIRWVVALVVLCLLPLVLPRFYVYLVSIILLYGLLATSNDFPLGFGGVSSFTMLSSTASAAHRTALAIMKSGLSPWLAFMIGPLLAAF